MFLVSTIGRAKALGAATAFLAMAAVSSAASAVTFSGTYNVNALESDPGLVIKTADLANPLNFTLNSVGDSTSFALFDIWTDETAVNFDDIIPASISVEFDFTAPPSLGWVDGTTMAGTILFASAGVLEWNGPTDLAFGDGGILRVSLTDAMFNADWGMGLTPGRENGATVHAAFELVSNAAVVPLPAGLPLLLSALGGLVFLRKRKEAAAAA